MNANYIKTGEIEQIQQYDGKLLVLIFKKIKRREFPEFKIFSELKKAFFKWR